MKLLDMILADLEKLNIPYEEHYDPQGALLFKLYLQDSYNPMMIRPPGNEDHILFNLTVHYPLPLLEKVPDGNKNHLDAVLKRLGSKLFMRNKIELHNDSLHFSSGFFLTSEGYNSDVLKYSLDRLMQSYNMVIDATNDLIHNN